MKTYHVATAKQGKTLIIQARRDIDALGCEIYDYWGERETTKKKLYQNRYQLLSYLKKTNPTVYGSLRFTVVD